MTILKLTKWVKSRVNRGNKTERELGDWWFSPADWAHCDAFPEGWALKLISFSPQTIQSWNPIFHPPEEDCWSRLGNSVSGRIWDVGFCSVWWITAYTPCQSCSGQPGIELEGRISAWISISYNFLSPLLSKSQSTNLYSLSFPRPVDHTNYTEHTHFCRTIKTS